MNALRTLWLRLTGHRPKGVWTINGPAMWYESGPYSDRSGVKYPCGCMLSAERIVRWPKRCRKHPDHSPVWDQVALQPPHKLRVSDDGKSLVNAVSEVIRLRGVNK